MCIRDRNNRALLVDVAVPGETRVNEKEEEKVDKYQNLATEIKRLWEVEARVILTVIGILEMITRGLEDNLKTVGIT